MGENFRSSTLAIRQAVPEDNDWLIAQLKEFATFFGTKKSLFGDEAYVRTAMLGLMQNHLVLIATKGVERVGFIAGTVTSHSFNPAIRVLSETLWWVAKAYRRTRAALLLINAFIAWGKDKAVDWIAFGLETISPVNDKTLTRRGFTLKERCFLLEVSS